MGYFPGDELFLSSNGILKGRGELASRSPRYDGNVETGTRPLTERIG